MSTVQADDRDGGVRVLTLDRPPANARTHVDHTFRPIPIPEDASCRFEGT